MPKTLSLELGSLSASNTARIVCVIFEVSSIPKSLANLIYNRCKGHPRFIYEISELLLTEEKVEIKDGVCKLLQKDLDQIELPNTIRAVFVSRMDQLSSSEQITLKVASVIGPVFSMQLVCDIYPSGASELQIADDMASLLREGMIQTISKKEEALISSRRSGFHQQGVFKRASLDEARKSVSLTFKKVSVP